MSFEEWKEGMRDEWQFWKRNPEFPIMLFLSVASCVYSIMEESK